MNRRRIAFFDIFVTSSSALFGSDFGLFGADVGQICQESVLLFLPNSPSIVQYSSGLKALIASSRSQISRKATDCTRPAESPEAIFFHKMGILHSQPSDQAPVAPVGLRLF